MRQGGEIDQRRRLFLTKFSLPIQEKKEGDLKTDFIPLPYIKDTDYSSYCQTCTTKKCVDVCEENIIFINQAGVAEVRFNNRGCTFCEACVKGCTTPELNALFDTGYAHIEASIKLSIESCLAWNKTICYSCKDICDARAITFSGLFYPQIQDHCTHCGFCISVCPTEAISILPFKKEANRT